MSYVYVIIRHDKDYEDVEAAFSCIPKAQAYVTNEFKKMKARNKKLGKYDEKEESEFTIRELELDSE